MTIAATHLSNDFNEHEHVKKYARQMLKNTLFTGNFQEKRFVEPLNAYRDVITISADEEAFVKNLRAVKKRVEETFLKTPWIGITEPDTIGAPAGWSLWVELSEEVSGKYWYRVKGVDFQTGEVRLKLEVIRSVSNNVSTLTELSCFNDGEEPSFDLSQILLDMKRSSKQNAVYFFKEILTIENTKNSIVFLCCLLGTLTVGAAKIVQYLLEYTLKFIREISGFIEAVTPIVNNFATVLGKIIFGLYHLIFAMFKKEPPVYYNYLNVDSNQLRNYSNGNVKALPYYPTRRSQGPSIRRID